MLLLGASGDKKVWFKFFRGGFTQDDTKYWWNEKTKDGSTPQGVKDKLEKMWLRGYNSMWFRVPIYNLFHPFIATQVRSSEGTRPPPC